jgi:hypothetical protein
MNLQLVFWQGDSLLNFSKKSKQDRGANWLKTAKINNYARFDFTIIKLKIKMLQIS